jgi:hypothetical protein
VRPTHFVQERNNSTIDYFRRPRIHRTALRMGPLLEGRPRRWRTFEFPKTESHVVVVVVVVVGQSFPVVMSV